MQVPFLACLAAVLVFAPAVRAQGDCVNGLGYDYSGTVSTTAGGLTCQRWDSQVPHGHSMTNFPNDDSISAAENYCRNPDENGGGLWCYTEDWWTAWQYCDVPGCPGECVNGIGLEYSGTVSKTSGSITCQRWDSQVPHGHGFTESDFPNDDSISAAENYCRNPNNNGGPWCYTEDWWTYWQFCDVPACAVPEVGCRDADDTFGTGYTGGLSTTVGGLTCQRWDAQSPHGHSMTDPDMYPDASIEAANNYCRNPDDNSGGLWCYTTDWFTAWQRCAVPVCACQNTMDVYEQMHAEGGEGVEGVDSIDSCNALCFADSDCLGVDYDLSDNPWRGIRCWLHIGDLGGALGSNPNVNHYEVAVRC